MTIKEAEERTGLARSNIRFYEKEGLVQPARNPQNGYREYTEENIEDIRKIAYLRTLGISIETIRKIIHHEVELTEEIRKQEQILEKQISDMEKAREICRQIAEDESAEYDTLCIENYTADVQRYWKDNEKLFHLDSVTFVSVWGGAAVWAVITLLCLMTAVFIYPHLPEQIPVQYHNGEVSSEAKKIFIFAYPAACVIIRLILRVYIRGRVAVLLPERSRWDLITDYLTNSLCFIALSVEIFSILYLYGYVKNIVLLFIIDAVVLLFLLGRGIRRMPSGFREKK